MPYYCRTCRMFTTIDHHLELDRKRQDAIIAYFKMVMDITVNERRDRLSWDRIYDLCEEALITQLDSKPESVHG